MDRYYNHLGNGPIDFSDRVHRTTARVKGRTEQNFEGSADSTPLYW